MAQTVHIEGTTPNEHINDFTDLNDNPMNMLPSNENAKIAGGLERTREGLEINDVQETTERVELSCRTSWAKLGRFSLEYMLVRWQSFSAGSSEVQ
ncbi:hypothetical protein BT93_L2344 [Corymbia citriodora subsp. variegata]|uniref:Uncharacterized protein n=1 Tax=Corymbia citriodora subsp. variegata TaxID=360336 RepID=A0A8T0CK86_CORYI|nr:hypothetical protein BT93_L2344 [Corymbia citriodora subsp. variegata]